jgi:hypothetical protein
MKSPVLESSQDSVSDSNRVYALREFGTQSMVRFRHDELPYPIMAWVNQDNARRMGLALAEKKAWMTYVVEIDPLLQPVPVCVIDDA